VSRLIPDTPAHERGRGDFKPGNLSLGVRQGAVKAAFPTMVDRSDCAPKKNNMRIAVIGGTGRTGRLFVREALAAGHVVRLLARQPSRADGGKDGLEIKQGDVLDEAALKHLTTGVDAVVCLLGTSPSKPGTIMSEGTRNIVQAMKATAVRRLVLVSSDGSGETRAELPLTLRLGAFFVRKFMAEKEAQETIVRASNLDWTLVRPGQLTDGPLTGDVVTRRAGRPLSGKVSRADLAHFLISQLDEPESIGHSPQLFALDTRTL
jgi:uncharacterized protein YbjT (DUF2867 family)